MADYFWGKIVIGGDLHRQDLPQFCEAIGAEDEFELPLYTEDEHIVRDDSEACYGQYEELEDLCREIGLPYTRQSDGKYEFSPEIVLWLPGMDEPRHVVTDHDGSMQIAMDDVRELRDLLRAGDLAKALSLAEEVVVDLPPLPPFRIV